MVYEQNSYLSLEIQKGNITTLTQSDDILERNCVLV